MNDGCHADAIWGKKVKFFDANEVIIGNIDVVGMEWGNGQVAELRPTLKRSSTINLKTKVAKNSIKPLVKATFVKNRDAF